MSYSALQIRLHWLVAILVLVQFLTHTAMQDAMRALEAGDAPGFLQFLLSNVHLLSGLTAFALVGYRLYLRWQQARSLQGPSPARQSAERVAESPKSANKLALAVHWAFYIVLLLMPISGMLTYYQVSGISSAIHTWGKSALLFLLLLHVLAAFYHLLWRRDGVFQRMTKSL